jgi:hypothetical protein
MVLDFNDTLGFKYIEGSCGIGDLFLLGKLFSFMVFPD